MGHCSEILIIDKKSEIMVEAQEFAWRNADHEECGGRYHGNLQIKDIEFESLVDAEKYLAYYVGNYNDMAVKFKDWELKSKTKKQVNLENKVREINKELITLERPVQKTMTCPCCGKRVETTWRYFCPNCREDITPKTKKAKIQTLNDKLSKINVEIANLELKRRKKKFKTRWAVKVEVHC